MTFLKIAASALVAFNLCSYVAAQSAQKQIKIPAVLALPNCGPEVPCGGADVEVTTMFIGEPVYVTTNITEVSTQVHTTTSTTVVPYITTVTSTTRGICNIVTTKTVTTRETIPVTRTVVKLEHQAVSVIETSTHTISATVEETSACIKTINNVLGINSPTKSTSRPGGTSSSLPPQK